MFAILILATECLVVSCRYCVLKWGDVAVSDEKDEKEEKRVKLEDVAEETGELVGKGVRKTWSVMKSFGRGMVNTLEGGEEQKNVEALTCPHCGTSTLADSTFCAKCGKKL